MSKTTSNQILSIFLPQGWEPIKASLKRMADAQSNPELRNVSGLVRAVLAKELSFVPKPEDPPSP